MKFVWTISTGLIIGLIFYLPIYFFHYSKLVDTITSTLLFISPPITTQILILKKYGTSIKSVILGLYGWLSFLSATSVYIILLTSLKHAHLNLTPEKFLLFNSAYLLFCWLTGFLLKKLFRLKIKKENDPILDNEDFI